MNLEFSNKYQIVAALKKFLRDKDSNIFFIIFVICCIYSLGALSIGWNNKLLDQNGFRQTQTAITAYYILQGGPWIGYETPVLGYPWSIPFEFPLYQWLVAILVKLFHTPLDQTGRFVSAFFFYLSLIPSYIILDYLNIPKYYRWILLSLFLTSPLYLFWSRTFTIESTALFFSLAYLAAVGYYFRHKSFLFLALAILFGTLGALIKITTFAGFLLAAFLFTLHNWLNNHKSRADTVYNLILPTLLFFLLPCIAASAWTHFADSQKLLNPLAADFLTSKTLTAWNFGTLKQRFSFEILKTIVRAFRDLLGNWQLATILLVTFPFFSHQYKQIYFSAISIFFAVIFTFTNLHIVHNYYQYANGIFIIVAIGFGLSGLLERRGLSKLSGYGVFALILIFQMQAYNTIWTELIKVTNKPLLETTEMILKYTNSNDVLLIHGLDWSSEMAYYSQRRAVMAISGESKPKMKIEAAIAQLSGYKLGAIIFCNQERLNSDKIVSLAKAYKFQVNSIYANSLCEVHLPLTKQ